MQPDSTVVQSVTIQDTDCSLCTATPPLYSQQYAPPFRAPQSSSERDATSKIHSVWNMKGETKTKTLDPRSSESKKDRLGHRPQTSMPRQLSAMIPVSSRHPHTSFSSHLDDHHQSVFFYRCSISMNSPPF